MRIAPGPARSRPSTIGGVRQTGPDGQRAADPRRDHRPGVSKAPGHRPHRREHGRQPGAARQRDHQNARPGSSAAPTAPRSHHDAHTSGTAAGGPSRASTASANPADGRRRGKPAATRRNARSAASVRPAFSASSQSRTISRGSSAIGLTLSYERDPFAGCSPGVESPPPGPHPPRAISLAISARARWRWLFTVPSGRSSISAMSS